MARIVLTAFGSLGDLHPSIAIALALQERGHQAVLATAERYRAKVEALGIAFRAVRPDLPASAMEADLMRRIMDARRGTEFIVREMLMPVLRESYEDLLLASEGADLLVSHPITFAARLVAEKQGLLWASTMTAPIGFFSAHDPPVLPTGQFLARLRFLGPGFHRVLHGLIKRLVGGWSGPWRRLRAEIGLPPAVDDPVFEGQHSPFLVLALFSRALAAKQPDWPQQTVITGFPFHDQDGPAGLPAGLAGFLERGPAPIVFTLGSSAVLTPGSFYRESAEAARILGRRAVLLVGKEAPVPPGEISGDAAAFDYAPYSLLFPRAAAIVHHGGVGTTGQAMRSGRPMLVMPYAHDQPDNAGRVTRLGVGRTLGRGSYTARRAAAELRMLLEDPAYARCAEEVARIVREEDGAAAAGDALERLLSRARPAPTAAG